MRPLLLSLYVVAFLFLENCRKDTPPPTTPPDPIDTTDVPIDTPPITHVIDFGKHFVSKNNTAWTPKPKALYYKDKKMFSLIAESINTDGLEESIDISDIPAKIGKYTYEYFPGSPYYNFIPQVAFFHTLDGDQLVGAYSIDLTRPDNYIEVVRYDSVNHIVEGRYQAILDNKSAPFPGVPDSMFLLNGRFHLKIDTI